MDTEAETGQTAAGLESQTRLLTSPDGSQKSHLPSHIIGVQCRYRLQPESLAVSASGSRVEILAQPSTSRPNSTIIPGEVAQSEATGATDSQRSQTDQQPGNSGYIPEATPAANTCKPLVPVFAKHKRHVFKVPAPVPAGREQTSQCKPPSRQTYSSVQTAQSTGNKPVFVFDGLQPPSRHVVVPTSFDSLHSYQQSWCAAVTEEVNIRSHISAFPFCLVLPQAAWPSWTSEALFPALIG